MNPLHILWRTAARYGIVPARFEPLADNIRPSSGRRPFIVSPENAGKPTVLIFECHDMPIAIITS